MNRWLQALQWAFLASRIQDIFFRLSFVLLVELNSKIAFKLAVIESSNLDYLNTGTLVLKLASTLHENYLTKGKSEKREILNLLLSNRRLHDKKLDAELLPPVSYIAEYVKTRDMRAFRYNYHNHFIKNPSDVERWEKFFEKYPIAI